MDKSLNLRFTNRRTMKLGALAIAMVSLTACSDDAPTASDNGPIKQETPAQIATGVNLTVGKDGSLATTFFNSRNALGTRAANDVPEHPGMPAIPSAEELAAMIVPDEAFKSNPWAITVNLPAGSDEAAIVDPQPDKTKPFNVRIPAGNYNSLPAVIHVNYVAPGYNIDHAPWYVSGFSKQFEINNVNYYIDGEVTIGGNGQEAPMAIHILNGSKYTCNEVSKGAVDVYVYPGGDILKASQSGDEIYIKGNLYAASPISHKNTEIKVEGKIYTYDKIHGKKVILNGGEVYAGCAVTAEESIYLTGDDSKVCAGYVSAPTVQLATSDKAVEIVLRDGGYLHATSELLLKNIGNVLVRAEDGDYAMIETPILEVNDKRLQGTFYNVAVKYDRQTGTQEKGPDETEVVLEWNETVKVNGLIDYTVTATGDECAPYIVEAPAQPTPDPVLENIGEIAPSDHSHPISATCINTYGSNAYISWHTQGSGFHGCIEHAVIENGTVTLKSYLETDLNTTSEGAIDFNHTIFDNGKLFVAGDHPKKGGILGWIECADGSFESENSATLNMITLFNNKYVDSDSIAHWSNGGSGNCIIRNGNYYQVASVAGFESFAVSDFAAGAKPKAAYQLASWAFDPSISENPFDPWTRDGSRTGKHIATDGSKVVMLSLINRSTIANTANASIKVFNASDVQMANPIASYVVNDVLVAPVDGKDVVAINGNDIWVCLGQGGVKHLNLSGSTITETASFKLAGMSADDLKGWELKGNETNSAANGLAVDDNYVYVAHGTAGLVVLDKQTLKFVTRTRYTGGKSANYISLNEDGYIYVAYGLSKVQVYGWKK